MTKKEHNLNIQNTRWTSSQHYSSKEEGVGGVGWGRFVAISPLQKNWGSRIEGGVRNTRVSHSSLNSGGFTFHSCEDLGMFKLRAKNNIHHQKEPELAKKEQQQQQ